MKNLKNKILITILIINCIILWYLIYWKNKEEINNFFKTESEVCKKAKLEYEIKKKEAKYYWLYSEELDIETQKTINEIYCK